jgi:hypothetical protein
MRTTSEVASVHELGKRANAVLDAAFGDDVTDAVAAMRVLHLAQFSLVGAVWADGAELDIARIYFRGED